MNTNHAATPTNVLDAHNALILRGLSALTDEAVISTYGAYMYVYGEHPHGRTLLIRALRKAVANVAPWVIVRDIGVSLEVSLANVPEGEQVIPAELASFLIAVTPYAPMPDKAPTVLIEDQRKELYSASILLDGTIMVTRMSMGKVVDPFTADNMDAVFATISENATAVRKSSFLSRLFGRN